MVTEDFVSFEVAKLLKEKGFNENCFALYNPNEELIQCGVMLNNTQVGRVEGSYSAPTHQMTMKWLREVHHIHANPIRQGNYDDLSEDYSWIVARGGIIYRNQSVSERLSYEDACESAIKYCLEKLI